MKKQSIFLTLMSLTLVVVLVTACSPSAAPVVPTQDSAALAQTADSLKTQVAGTLVTGFTQTAEANPTATNTASPEPSSTPEPTASTAPSITPPPTVAVATLAPTRIVVVPTATVTRGPFQCAVTKQSLTAGIEIDPGVDFDARWTVKNTGTEDWASGAADYEYVSGDKLQEGDDAYDLNVGVDTGKTVDIVVDMVAPKESGRYQATWAVTQDGTVMCYMSLDIRVK